MKIRSVGSSSAGNGYLIDDGGSVILIECGFTLKNLTRKVREKGYALSLLSGVLISHEHKDHAKCWDGLVKMGLRVYASTGTIGALANEDEMLAELLISISPDPGKVVGEPVQIGSYDVMAFRTFHDAAEPIGFLIRSRVDREKLVFATDTVNLGYRFPGVTKMMLEANYAESIAMKSDRIPENVKHRIRNTHMELGTLCQYLRGLDLSECREIYLMHLSDAGSDEHLFYHSVRAAVPDHVKVYIFDK